MIVRVPVSRGSHPLPLALMRRGRPAMRPRGFRGLGDCAPNAGDVYGGVPYCRDNLTGSLVPCGAPQCGAGAGVLPSNTPTVYTPNYAGSPSQAVPFGLATSTIPTLDAYMQNWLSEITAVSPASLGISSASDLMTSAAQMARSYCQEAGSPADCANMSAVAAKYGAMAVAAFSNVRSSQFSPSTYTDYSGPVGSPGGTPFAAGSPTPLGAPVSLTTGKGDGILATVAMKNLTRAGADTAYQVGDQWQLTITGAPGAAVTGAASQNGSSLGTTPFGSLNSAGQMVLTGAMTAGQVGSWQETWNVGNSPAVGISFSVAAAPAGSSAGVATSKSGPSNATSTTPAAGGFTFPDISAIPSWAWLAGGGVVLLMFLKK